MIDKTNQGRDQYLINASIHGSLALDGAAKGHFFKSDI